MEVKLHLIKGNPKGKEVEVPTGILKVGRAEDSDLIIASSRISRHHCEIIHEGGKLFLRDKGSGNGSFVNGTKVEGEQALKAGDEVAIGPLTFALVIDGVGLPAEPAEATPEAAAPAAPSPTAAPASALGAKPKPGAPQPKAPAVPLKPAAAVAPGAKGKPTLAARPPATPIAKPPAAGAKPSAAPLKGGKSSPADVLSSLERLAAPKKPGGAPATPPKPPAKPGAKKSDDVIEISDEDLLDS